MLYALENFDKKYRAAGTLISNHKLSNNCSRKIYTERLFFFHKMSLSNIGNNKFFNNFYAQHIKMGQNYKNTDLLKFLPFYTSEIQKSIKKTANKKRSHHKT